MQAKSVAIVGAGPAGLMAAEVLSQSGYAVEVFEQMPSAARKFLMAGKTGLNISHAEALPEFIQRYDHADWLKPWLEQWDATWIRQWMGDLGIESYVGTSGRIFPVEMKAAPLLRAWLKRLTESGVVFHYRHRCVDIQPEQVLCFQHTQMPDAPVIQQKFSAIILACGAVSWSRLGSDGAWQAWLKPEEIKTFQASNAGVERTWSSYMQPVFGQPLKRVKAWVDQAEQASMGDIVITQYGLESGLIYKLNRALRQQSSMQLYLDVLPELTQAELTHKLQPHKKQSMANIWRKAGLDAAKANLVRELVPKTLWQQPEALAAQIKQLPIALTGFRPIDEAISCAGGVKQDVLSDTLQLKQHAGIFCCGEMLDWDAPTGGYLLTACFATGRAAAQGVAQFLS